jgi:hypothetical protein
VVPPPLFLQPPERNLALFDLSCPPRSTWVSPNRSASNGRASCLRWKLNLGFTFFSSLAHFNNLRLFISSIGAPSFLAVAGYYQPFIAQTNSICRTVLLQRIANSVFDEAVLDRYTLPQPRTYREGRPSSRWSSTLAKVRGGPSNAATLGLHNAAHAYISTGESREDGAHT